MLAKANVMTFRKCGTQGRVNKMVLHAANHAFAKAFLIKHFRRSERVRQHMTETLQVAGCVEGGVLGVAAATVQRNVELRDSPEQQAASLGGTGVSAEQANAPPVLSSALVATHTPVAPQATGNALMLIDRLPEGPDRTSLIMRAFEHELAKGDDAHKANEARKDAEFKAEEDRRIVVHNATMAEITDRRLQNRQRAEADLSRTNLEIRDVKLQQLRSLLDHCTDDHQRAYLQGAYAMVAQAPTEVKLAVDTTASEAPVPLTQAVLNTGSGSLSELQLPARFNVLNAFTDNYVTVNTFVQTCYPHVKLTSDQLKALGALVAKTFDQACAGRPVRTRSLGPNEAHAPRAYPIMSLLEPPLKDTIERFVKSPPAPKRRATAPPAGEGPATRRATAGSLDGFVTTVTGVPRPPPSAR